MSLYRYFVDRNLKKMGLGKLLTRLQDLLDGTLQRAKQVLERPAAPRVRPSRSLLDLQDVSNSCPLIWDFWINNSNFVNKAVGIEQDGNTVTLWLDATVYEYHFYIWRSMNLQPKRIITKITLIFRKLFYNLLMPP